MCLNTTVQLLKYVLCVPILVSPHGVTLSSLGSVKSTVASITPRPLHIPEGRLEIPIMMHFVHQNKLILQKMKTFVDGQVNRMTEVFPFEEV